MCERIRLVIGSISSQCGLRGVVPFFRVFRVMKLPKVESPFVTENSFVQRPFFVLVDQILMSNDPSCLDLNEGDIFLVTKYNKVGYWWGVSIYDLNRQGWFPSTFVQPYTGEVTEEAQELLSKIKTPLDQKTRPQPSTGSKEQKCEPVKFNLVTQDVYPFQEYESTVAIGKRGREIVAADGTYQPQPEVESDIEFDYETWADAKNESRRNGDELDPAKRKKG